MRPVATSTSTAALAPMAVPATVDSAPVTLPAAAAALAPVCNNESANKSLIQSRTSQQNNLLAAAAPVTAVVATAPGLASSEEPPRHVYLANLWEFIVHLIEAILDVDIAPEVVD